MVWVTSHWDSRSYTLCFISFRERLASASRSLTAISSSCKCWTSLLGAFCNCMLVCVWREEKLTMFQSNKLINKISNEINFRQSSYCSIHMYCKLWFFLVYFNNKIPLWEWGESVSYFICIGHFWWFK